MVRNRIGPRTLVSAMPALLVGIGLPSVATDGSDRDRLHGGAGRRVGGAPPPGGASRTRWPGPVPQGSAPVLADARTLPPVRLARWQAAGSGSWVGRSIPSITDTWSP